MQAVRKVLMCVAMFTLAGGCDNKSASTPPVDGSPATQPSGTQPANSGPRVEFLIGHGSEDWGRIVLELNDKKAPDSVANFLRYVGEGYYDGTIFHRVRPDFMIQGGGFTAPGQKKTDGQHGPIRNESRNGLHNTAYTIAMARTARPNSATSEFFINVVDNRRILDATPGKWGYAVFGKVVEGQDVVNRIRDVEIRANPDMPGQGGKPELSLPVDPPILRKARMLK